MGLQRPCSYSWSVCTNCFPSLHTGCPWPPGEAAHPAVCSLVPPASESQPYVAAADQHSYRQPGYWHPSPRRAGDPGLPGVTVTDVGACTDHVVQAPEAS